MSDYECGNSDSDIDQYEGSDSDMDEWSWRVGIPSDIDTWSYGDSMRHGWVIMSVGILTMTWAHGYVY